MNKIFRAASITFIVFVLSAMNLSAQNTVDRNNNQPPTEKEKREAEKAWEGLIKTKGGREKLHSVTNMLRELSFGDPDIDLAELHVFPNYYWEFAYHLDGRPSASLWNGEKSIQQSVTESGPISTTIEKDSEASDWFSLERIVYLLETKWDKPELLRVTRIKQGKKNFDVIEAVVKNQRIDFIYEPEEMLVLEINLYYLGAIWRKYSFLNYTEINGIKMPQKEGLKQGKNMDKKKLNYNSVKFSLNVEYDPQLFERPLKATTPDAWKPQKPTN